MIAPTKHISIESSLIGVGAAILRILTEGTTITALWEKARSDPTIGSFHRLVLALDLLYTLGAIEMRGGVITRARR
jgi:hypothetical protein